MLDYTGSDLALSSASESTTGLGLSRDVSRSCMVADTLAWAVAHGIPIPEALATVPFYVRLPSRRLRHGLTRLRDSLVPFRPFAWFANTRWSWNLGLVIQDLGKGDPLSAALERHLGRDLPGFYLMAVAKAERDQRLDTALPVLARQLNFPAAVASERKIEFFFAAWKIFIALNVLLFISVTVIPKFGYILEDLEGTTPALLAPVAAMAGLVLKVAIFTLVCVWILSKLEGIGEYVLLHVPWLGREWKRFILTDLARSMAVFLRQGDDVLTAAEWSIKSTRSQWLRKRLDRFVAELRAGGAWVEEWSRMGLGDPLSEWLVRSAAAREDPASGFELLAEWLHQEIALTTRRLERWIDPCSTLLIALVVGFLAHHVFTSVTSIIYMAAGR